MILSAELISQQMSTVPLNDALTTQQDLQQAFQSFTQLSAQLADSYQQLQSHVCELQEELVITNQEKVAASEDKQNMAHRMQRLLELLPGGVIVLDESGVIEQCNPAAQELLGDVLAGLAWSQVISERFAPQTDDGHEISVVDGRRLSIATRSLDQGKGQIILLTDQTETRALQDQLSRHNRLNTMGKMVAYLAHQIRTPLASAMLYAGHINDGALNVVQLNDFSAKLLRQITNVEQQVSDLLIFARGDSVINKSISVSELFVRLQRELDGSPLLKRVDISYSNQAAEFILQCNPQALISAITNLVNNAREAAAEHQPNMQTKVNITAILVNAQLNLLIADNGPGISREQKSRVLEPFYSTKARGTGLGLAVVQAVVESLGGGLSLESPVIGGLQIRLRLPVSMDAHIQ
ncbi:MAG: two-component system sensor histidine kinase FlrB [Candidatus Pseudothioglobus sp.]